MSYHQGRLIDHVHLRVADLERSRRFYRSVLESIQLGDAYGETPNAFFADELYVEAADDYTSRIHLAFQARDQQSVDRFYEAALANGGRSNGAPGIRAYHAQYYSAFVFDPDGNNIEVVCDAPVTRSAESVVIQRNDVAE